jgi:hypothetical protein
VTGSASPRRAGRGRCGASPASARSWARGPCARSARHTPCQLARSHPPYGTPVEDSETHPPCPERAGGWVGGRAGGRAGERAGGRAGGRAANQLHDDDVAGLWADRAPSEVVAGTVPPRRPLRSQRPLRKTFLQSIVAMKEIVDNTLCLVATSSGKKHLTYARHIVHIGQSRADRAPSTPSAQQPATRRGLYWRAAARVEGYGQAAPW